MTMDELSAIIDTQFRINDCQMEINKKTKAIIDNYGEVINDMIDYVAKLSNTLSMIIDVQSRFYRNIEN